MMNQKREGQWPPVRQQPPNVSTTTSQLAPATTPSPNPAIINGDASGQPPLALTQSTTGVAEMAPFASTTTLLPSSSILFSDAQSATSGPTQSPSSVHGMISQPSDSEYNNGPWQHQDGPPVRIVMAAAIPIILLAVGGVLLAYVLRRRRRKQVHDEVMAELKVQSRGDASQAAPPYTASPQFPAPAATGAGAGVGAGTTASMSLPALAAAPVVISPMAPGMGAAYFTGIDTSDAVSIVSNNLAPNGFAFDPEHGEEPPPPYRPRSVAAVSRETSLRQLEHPRISRSHLTPPPEEERRRSPFEDPEDEHDEHDEHDEDDAVSMVSEEDEREGSREEDRLSDVSDLSYQDAATAHHPV